MTDRSMPDYDAEPNEWESSRALNVPRNVEVQLKSFTNRIQTAHTVLALAAIRRDIEQGALANTMAAKEQLKRLMNARAGELGFKGAHGERWWQ